MPTAKAPPGWHRSFRGPAPPPPAEVDLSQLSLGEVYTVHADAPAEIDLSQLALGEVYSVHPDAPQSYVSLWLVLMEGGKLQRCSAMNWTASSSSCLEVPLPQSGTHQLPCYRIVVTFARHLTRQSRDAEQQMHIPCPPLPLRELRSMLLQDEEVAATKAAIAASLQEQQWREHLEQAASGSPSIAAQGHVKQPKQGFALADATALFPKAAPAAAHKAHKEWAATMQAYPTGI